MGNFHRKRSAAGQQGTDLDHLKSLVIENMFEAVILTDEENRIIDWNPAAELMFGFTRAEVVGLFPKDLLHTPDQIPDLQIGIEQAIQTVGRFTGEVLYTAKNGTPIWCQTVIFPVRDALGQVVARVGLKRDITEQVRARDIQERYAGQLEALCSTSLEINTDLDLNQVLRDITAQATRFLGVEKGALYLADPEGTSLVMVVAHQLPEDLLGTRLAFGEGLSGVAAQSGQMEIVEDYSTWPGRAGHFKERGFHRVIALPLKARGRVIGVISALDDRQIGGFSTEEKRLASLFADQASTAVENFRMYLEMQHELAERRRAEAAEREQRIVTEALDESASALTSTLNLSEVLQAILDSVTRVMPNDAATLMLIEDGWARVVGSRGYRERGLQSQLDAAKFRVDDIHNLRWMANSGLPMVIPDTAQDPNWVSLPDLEWLRSYAGAPIRVRGQVLGFLNVDSTVPGFYEPVQASRLQSFADHAGIALENARLFEESEKRARYLNMLNDITRSAISAPDLQTMLDTLANRLYQLIDADGAYITLWDPIRERAMPAAAYEPMAEVYPRILPVPGELSMTSSVLKAERVLVAEDVTNSPYIDPLIAAQYPEQSILAMPLIADGNKLGAALISFYQKHQFTSEEVALAEQVSGQIALAISKMQLIETERRQRIQLTRANTFISALGSVAARIESIPDPGAMMETLGAELAKLNVRCLVGQVDKTSGEMAMQYISLPAPILRDLEKLSGCGMSSFRLANSQVDLIRELVGKDGLYLSHPLSFLVLILRDYDLIPMDDIMRMTGIEPDTRVVCLPLSSEDAFSGVLAIWGEDLAESDLPALSVFAGQVSVTLDNARLYADVQRLAITDEMTGLYNRRGLYDLGSREVERALRCARPLCALMMDIDHFKLVNDSYGHPAGDEVLRELGVRCRSITRAIDINARYGGEEFFFLFIETDREAALQVADRLRTCFDGIPIHTQAGEVFITVSLGLVEVNEDTPDLASVIQKADQALYKAKQTGRNRVAILTDRLDPKKAHKL